MDNHRYTRIHVHNRGYALFSQTRIHVHNRGYALFSPTPAAHVRGVAKHGITGHIISRHIIKNAFELTFTGKYRRVIKVCWPLEI